MTDAERDLLAQHARELLDLGPRWKVLWAEDTVDCWTVAMLGPKSQTTMITIADHAAWLAARQQPLPDDARTAPVVTSDTGALPGQPCRFCHGTGATL